MAILKWVEYEIVCDKCFDTIIGYNSFETRQAVKDAYKLKFGKNPVKDKMLCFDCLSDSLASNVDVDCAKTTG